jgi:chromosome segregation ATPase
MATQRWTDEMLDSLASSVGGLRESVGELRVSVGELRVSVGELRVSVGELRESVGELRYDVDELRGTVDGVRITTQALLQLAAQHQERTQRHDQEMELMKQRQAESDERFNTLLAEVRYLIRRWDRPEQS